MTLPVSPRITLAERRVPAVPGGGGDLNLLFRRQFVLGPAFVEGLPSWARHSVRETLRLTVHPDLPVCQATEGRRSVTLLGYALDPERVEADDREIAAGLLRTLQESDGGEAFLEAAGGLGGRWVLIADDGAEVRLLHDPMGLRQVFSSDRNACGALWCASQPALLAEVLGLEPDPAALAYTESLPYRRSAEYLWPGDTCLYREITHLLPNHWLDLTTGERTRYWPRRPLPRLTLREGVEKSARLLTRLIEAASRRFPLALATTAGWDTRLILASARPVSRRMHYYTLLRSPDGYDTTVPPRLLARLGLSHQMISIPARMDPEFEELYRRSVTTAHEFWGTMAQALHGSYPRERVSVTGNGAEIARVRLWFPAEAAVTPAMISRLTLFHYDDELEREPFVTRAWERWLGGLGETFGLRVLELFEWEHWAGNFAAMGQSEWDIVQEAFTPYNCRRLLETMLSVDPRHRHHEKPRLYRRLIRRLWPETLSEPVNAPPTRPIAPVLAVARALGISRLLPEAWKHSAKRGLARLLESP